MATLDVAATADGARRLWSRDEGGIDEREDNFRGVQSDEVKGGEGSNIQPQAQSSGVGNGWIRMANAKAAPSGDVGRRFTMCLAAD